MKVDNLLRALVVAPLAVLGLACGSSSSPSPFNGSWSCTETSAYRYTMPATTQPLTLTRSLDLVFDIQSGDPLVFTTPASDAGTVGDAGAGCSLIFSTVGSEAVLNQGQKCPVSFRVGNATVNYTIDFSTGSATVTGNQLTVTTASTFTGTSSNSAVTVNYAGSTSGTTTCTK